MIVRCTNCNTAFSVKDEKVENKKFAFNCPSCSTENIVDNTKHLTEHQFADSGTSDSGREQTPPPAAGVATEQDFIVSEQEDQFPDSEESLTEKDAAEILSEDEDTFFLEEDSAAERDENVDEEENLSLDDFSAEDIKMDLESTEELLDSTEKLDEIPSEIPELETDISGGDLEDNLELEEFADESSLLMEDSSEPLSADIDDIELEDAIDLDIGSEISEPEGDADSTDLSMEPLDKLKEEAFLDDETEELNLDDIPVYDSDTDELPEEDLLEDFEPLEDSSEIDLGEDLTTLDSDLSDETPGYEDIKAEEVYSKNELEEDNEDITIDLDALDIELEEDSEEAPGHDDITSDVSEFGEEIIEEPLLSMEDSSDTGDEDITLDLDSLDIDLEEEETISTGELSDVPDIDTDNIFAEETFDSDDMGEDEDITLDLDALDIPLDESEEILKGEEINEDEKLTLEDAGLTLEELTSDEIQSMAQDHDETEEDIKLTIDDIDPELSIEDITAEKKDNILFEEKEEDNESLLLDDFEDDDDLPEIDFDSFEGDTAVSNTKKTKKVSQDLDEDLIDIDFDSDYADSESVRERLSDTVPVGAVSFSIDYSLKYSRLSSLLRLLQLYFIGMIPHFLVFLLYSVLSGILGFINHLVVFTTRQAVEDFAEIQENTLRYFLAINASLIGLVDEMPIFAGREDLDHPLQMSITRPYKNSRILAALRLSVVGILFITLPHLLILGILSVVLPFIYLIGIISILAIGKWPYLIFDFLIRYYRHTAQVGAYMIGLIDKYPSFTFN